VKNSSDLANLIISLPKNEQQWFKQFTKVSPESFKKATVETVERYAQRTGKSITPELEQQIAQKFGGKSLKQAVKTGGKIAFKWPAARRLTFDTSVLLSASLFAHKVEEYYKQSNAENLSQENIKNAEKFFNAIPQEVRDKVLDSISVNTLNNVLGGDFKKAADEIKQDKKKKLTPAQQKKLDDELSALF
jgi:hypothetical protein